MEFKEFFDKKKIDIERIKSQDKILYDELRVHFVQMNPKSFDYSKKYLFNKLRGKYPLKE